MITNKSNVKKYIGKSVRIEKRLAEHKRAKTNMAISKAIREYGPDSFSYEILELCSEDMLDDRESYWIDYYNTYSGNGYNAAPGGEGAPHPVKLSESDIDKIINELQNSSLLLSDIAKKYRVSRETISSINLGKSRIKNINYPIRQNHFGINVIPDKQELINTILANNTCFKTVADKYGVTRQCIVTWCKRYNIPCCERDFNVGRQELKAE